ERPVTSDGRRSGVNWIRRKLHPRLRAIALARTVLPVPGTSSMRRWPRQRSATRARRTSWCLPTITRSTLARTFSPVCSRVVIWLLGGIADWASGDGGLMDSTSRGRERFAVAPQTSVIVTVWCLGGVVLADGFFRVENAQPGTRLAAHGRAARAIGGGQPRTSVASPTPIVSTAPDALIAARIHSPPAHDAIAVTTRNRPRTSAIAASPMRSSHGRGSPDAGPDGEPG